MTHIHHYVPKNPEIIEHDFQTKLNKNIDTTSSSGFININGLYRLQFLHWSITWHSFMLCRTCGFLEYCFLEKYGFGTQIQTHKLEREIFTL